MHREGLGLLNNGLLRGRHMGKRIQHTSMDLWGLSTWSTVTEAVRSEGGVGDVGRGGHGTMLLCGPSWGQGCLSCNRKPLAEGSSLQASTVGEHIRSTSLLRAWDLPPVSSSINRFKNTGHQEAQMRQRKVWNIPYGPSPHWLRDLLPQGLWALPASPLHEELASPPLWWHPEQLTWTFITHSPSLFWTHSLSQLHKNYIQPILFTVS